MVGAGVVGLACAAALVDTGREVLLLERNRGIGEEVSARNSEVIHAGIYYAPGSLKARVCVAGKQKLYQYCADRGVAARRLGKLIVATSEEDLDTLNSLHNRGLKNGVDDLELLSDTAAKKMEPELTCLGALYSPSTGIVDSHNLMLSLLADLEAGGGQLSIRSSVQEIDVAQSPKRLKVVNDDTEITITADEVINCAGLGAVELAHRTQGLAAKSLPKAHFSKGNYFRVTGRTPFARLIYPAPVAGGLGIHLVLDLAGNARFGPDVEAIHNTRPDLQVDPSRAEGFYQSIRRYWPGVQQSMLVPDYAGIRPKISNLGSDKTDFKLLGPRALGVPGLVQCLGIESPGLTSCLALAEEVIEQLSAT